MQKAPLDMKEYLTAGEAVEYFGLSRIKFRALLNSGPQGFVTTFRKRKLIIRTELEKYLEQEGKMEELKNGKVSREAQGLEAQGFEERGVHPRKR